MKNVTLLDSYLINRDINKIKTSSLSAEKALVSYGSVSCSWKSAYDIKSQFGVRLESLSATLHLIYV